MFLHNLYIKQVRRKEKRNENNEQKKRKQFNTIPLERRMK